MSRRRQSVLFSRYSELPSRYTRRVTRTSCHSIPNSSAQSVNVSDTSANPTGLRVSAPLKMTSAISSPRSDFADCSPSAQRTASRTLDFPQPFGPIMAVMPRWKLKTVLSANDLKPTSSIDCKCIRRPQSRALGGQYQRRSGRYKLNLHNLKWSARHPTHDIVSSTCNRKLRFRPPTFLQFQSFQLRIWLFIVLARICGSRKVKSPPPDMRL